MKDLGWKEKASLPHWAPTGRAERDVGRFAGGRVVAAAETAHHHTALFHFVKPRGFRLQPSRKAKQGISVKKKGAFPQICFKFLQ